MKDIKTAIHPVYQWLLCYEDGRIENLRYGNGTGNYHKWIKGNKGYKGHLVSNLRLKGKRPKGLLIHRLIYEAFNGLIPDSYVVHHINHIPDDNRLENLVLLSRCDHNKLHNSKPVLQYAKDGTLLKEWCSTCEVKKQLGIDRRNVCKCCLGIHKTAYGYVWKYKE